MTSEDVIHSFFVPAFRTKQDVVPGRYTSTWFTTKTGNTIFSVPDIAARGIFAGYDRLAWMGMLKDYQNWLSGGAAEGSLAENGKKLFRTIAGNGYAEDTTGRCPVHQPVRQSGQTSGGGTGEGRRAYP